MINSLGSIKKTMINTYNFITNMKLRYNFKNTTDYARLTQKITDKQFIMIGEAHNSTTHIAFEWKIMKTLFNQNKPTALFLEVSNTEDYRKDVEECVKHKDRPLESFSKLRTLKHPEEILKMIRYAAAHSIEIKLCDMSHIELAERINKRREELIKDQSKHPKNINMNILLNIRYYALYMENRDGLEKERNQIISKEIHDYIVKNPGKRILAVLGMIHISGENDTENSVLKILSRMGVKDQAILMPEPVGTFIRYTTA